MSFPAPNPFADPAPDGDASGGTSGSTSGGAKWWKSPVLRSGFGLLLMSVAVLWIVQIVDEVALSDRLQNDGIYPRNLGGLDGIVWAPFLHAGFDHLISNTLPFLVLGGLVMTQGKRRWIEVTVGVILIGGLLTWIFGRTANHIGASGVVFGYFGYLIGWAVFRRSLAAFVTAAVALLLYGGLVFGLAPRAAMSWEGHLFGALSGLAAARIFSRRPDTDTDAVPVI